MITVESPITVDPVTRTIVFDYWNWGRQQPYGRVSTSLDAFKADYYGVITAKF